MARIKSELPRALTEISYSELRKRLVEIPVFRDKALLCITYACYGRIGEICRSQSEHSKPLKREDVQRFDKDGKQFLQIFLFTLKNHESRECFVNLEREKWLADPIVEWCERTNDYLFTNLYDDPLSSRYAEIIFKKYFGVENIHLMRSWRATHAARGDFTEDGKPLDLRAVMSYGGWKSPGTLIRIYTKAAGRDYLKGL